MLKGHTSIVSAVAFSPDGKLVVTGSNDKTARLWDTATGNPVATLAGHDGSVIAVAFSPDGKLVVTGSADKMARLWKVFSSVQALVEAVKASVPRCLSPAQRQQFHLGTVAPRWCHTRNLWPYADHGPTETQRSRPPYGPPAISWDELLIATWDRLTGWFTIEPAQNPPPPRTK